MTWTTSDASVAAVTDGKVTAVKAGTATITAKAGEKTATCTVTVKAKVIPVTSIQLDKTALELGEGDEASLTATVKPDNATDPTVTWTSSDASVAAVTDGKVTAIKVGTATITAKAGEKTATCTITVKAKVIPVTSIWLDHAELELTEGDEAVLTANVLPENATDKTVTWTSSDASVATVTDGTVKAVKPGSAVITAKAGEKTAKCTVTVKAAFIPVTSVTLDKTSMSLEVGDVENLIATVKPDNATDPTVTWTTSDESVASVSDGLVTALKEGTAVITAKAGEKTATCSVTVIYVPKPVIRLQTSSVTIPGYVSSTPGSVWYTLENAPAGECVVATTDDDWIWLGTVTPTEVPYTLPSNPWTETRTGTITLSYPNADPVTFEINQYSWSYQYTVLNVPDLVREVSYEAATYNIEYTITNPLEGYGFRCTTDPYMCDWLTPNIDGDVITFTVKENKSTQSRTCEITLKYTAAMYPARINVTQAGKPAGPPAFDFDSFNPDANNGVNAEGEESCPFYVRIVNPVPGVKLEMTADVAWITNLRPLTNAQDWYCFTASRNTTGRDRYGYVQLTYGTLTRKVKFMQQAGVGIIILDPGDMTINYKARSVSFNITLPEGYNYNDLEVAPDVSYYYVKNLTRNGGRVTFDLRENNDMFDRTVGIAVRLGDQQSVFHVTQTYEAPVFSVSPASLTVGYARQSKTIDVQVTNPREELSLSVIEENDTPWLWSSSPNNVPTINFAENSTGANRTSAVLIGYSKFAMGQVRLPVMQTTANTSVDVSPTSVSCDYKGKTQTFSISISDPLESAYLKVTAANPWIEVKSITDNSATVSIHKNLWNTPRSSSITFSYGSYSTVVPVTQGASNVPAGFVDLGLPSGTLWAETNVGASVEYETGSYFAWAETASKSSFYIENYKWGSDNMKKYNESDHRTSILLEDDAAYKANPNWTIPTKAQFDELCNECIWEWVLTPVAGMKVKSKVGDTYIFLPSTGYIDEKELSSNFEGFYWTKDLYTDDDWLAHMLSFMSMSYGTGPSYRYLGMPIRAVKK